MIDKHLVRVSVRNAVQLVVIARWHIAAVRGALPLVGTIGVALGVPAALLTDRWWLLPPVTVFGWWFAPHDWGWEWLSAVLMGIVGTEWAAVGAFSLGAWPDDRVFIGALWIGAAATLGLAAAALRRSARRQR